MNSGQTLHKNIYLIAFTDRMTMTYNGAQASSSKQDM